MKLFILDEHSEAMILAIQLESGVVVSPLTELEAAVQVRGIHLGGGMRSARYIRVRDQLAETIANAPGRWSAEFFPLRSRRMHRRPSTAARSTACIWRRWRSWE